MPEKSGHIPREPWCPYWMTVKVTGALAKIESHNLPKMTTRVGSFFTRIGRLFNSKHPETLNSGPFFFFIVSAIPQMDAPSIILVGGDQGDQIGRFLADWASPESHLNVRFESQCPL